VNLAIVGIVLSCRCLVVVAIAHTLVFEDPLTAHPGQSAAQVVGWQLVAACGWCSPVHLAARAAEAPLLLEGMTVAAACSGGAWHPNNQPTPGGPGQPWHGWPVARCRSRDRMVGQGAPGVDGLAVVDG
jgi:hypothetical protein